MSFLRWLVLCQCVLSSRGQTTGATDGGAPTTAASAVKKVVDQVSDLFPYKLPSEMRREDMPSGDEMSYSRPGFASIYPTFQRNFHIFLHPPKFCQAVYMCFLSKAATTSRGYSGIDFTSGCANSLRFLVMEQMVYHFSGGKATPYAYVKSYADFISKDGNGTFTFQVYADFDHENIEDASTTDVDISIGGPILLLTSSPYCHATLFTDEAHVAGEILRIEPDTDLTAFYKVHNAPKSAPYVVSGSMSGATYKSSGPRSEMYDIISKESVSDNEHCCAAATGFSQYLTGEEWELGHHKIVANAYVLELDPDPSCKREKDALTSPLMSFVIEIGRKCEWMRICFDKTEKKWCESEANIINILFNHEVFIPTDSDQAEPLALGYGKINRMRISFLYDEPAVELAYAYVAAKNPVVTHTMYLKVYEEVGKNPSKLYLHVVKDGKCRGRLLTEEEGLQFSAARHCLVVADCQCYKYD